MDYATLKAVHQGAVALSVAGFAARGAGALAGAAWVRGRAARTLPHAVDTVLLGSAVALAWTLRLSPADTPWLAAKILGLLAYIGLGMVAMRPAFAMRVRVVAFVAALATVAWIVAVAVTKDPSAPFGRGAFDAASPGADPARHAARERPGPETGTAASLRPFVLNSWSG